MVGEPTEEETNKQENPYRVSGLNQPDLGEEKDARGGKRGKEVPEPGRGWTPPSGVGEAASRSVYLTPAPGRGVLPPDE